ncbi:hypothetical protein MAP00_001529 [Monascus purpureus]|nr:hypothetical protein MAP00_001529 [Monascus purpureus]
MFSHIINPFIANAPMFGTAKADLAAAVTKAGGFGFIGGGFDFTNSSAQLVSLEKELFKARKLLDLKPLPDDAVQRQDNSVESLPVGVGFLTFHSDDASALISLIWRHRPLGIWLFAQAENQHRKLIPSLKSAGISWGMKIFVQIGSVKSAIEAVEDGADVIVVQGSDAGGHQFASNASIITSLPEISDAIKRLGRDVSILAAGGIMDGRGIAAALALGASGVVMGTRFAATIESSSSEVAKSVMVSTRDGAVSTAKSTLHDALQGRPDFWPMAYDGRAVISGLYRDVSTGAQSIEQAADTQKRAAAAGDGSNMVVWAGAGIGLIESILSAREVVEKSRMEANETMKSLSNQVGP